jgi:hypothetical protein
MLIRADPNPDPVHNTALQRKKGPYLVGMTEDDAGFDG